ncbi:hypothetical protein SCANM63S_03893 [Streptomyces canarius]
MRAARVSVPAVVVTVPVSSAFHRLNRQSTAVMVPTGSRVRCPTGSRQVPQPLPNSGRWSWTRPCWTVNRIWWASGSR